MRGDGLVVMESVAGPLDSPAARERASMLEMTRDWLPPGYCRISCGCIYAYTEYVPAVTCVKDAHEQVLRRRLSRAISALRGRPGGAA